MRLLGQQRGVAAGDQGADVEAFRLRSQQLDGLRADTTGAAEDGDAARGRESLPKDYTTTEGQRQQRRHRRRGQHAVKPSNNPP